MTDICIVGGSGLLGCSLIPYLRNSGFKVSCLSRKSISSDYVLVDFQNQKSLEEVLDACSPKFIINLAALTDVAACEKNPHFAYIANVKVVESLSQWILKRKKCHLIHISTDHIYDGPGPHVEKNIRIVNSYAMSKYAGELAASSVPHTILRTNFFGKSMCPSRDSFSDWVFEALVKGSNISVFNDVHFSPLSISTLIKFIHNVIENPILGTFNLGSNSGFTKAQFVYTFAKLFDFSTKNVTVSSIEDFDWNIPRPKDMRMECSKFESTYLQSELPELESEIYSVKGDYQNEGR